MAQFLSAI